MQGKQPAAFLPWYCQITAATLAALAVVPRYWPPFSKLFFGLEFQLYPGPYATMKES